MGNLGIFFCLYLGASASSLTLAQTSKGTSASSGEEERRLTLMKDRENLSPAITAAARSQNREQPAVAEKQPSSEPANKSLLPSEVRLDQQLIPIRHGGGPHGAGDLRVHFSHMQNPPAAGSSAAGAVSVHAPWMMDPALPVAMAGMDEPMYVHRITHVVGGHRASKGQFPSIVLFADLATGDPVCGGSVVNERWVLSAGHCLAEYRGRYKSVRAYVGRTSTDLRHREPDEQTLSVLKVIPHQKMIRPANGYDISLVKLGGKIKFGKYVKPVALPVAERSDPPRNSRLTVAGYGVTRQSGYIPSHMQYVHMRYVPDKVCQRMLRDQVGDHIVIRPEQLCAGGELGKDGCQGDSGGPLFDEDGVQVGIVSFGYGCGEPDTPGIYTQTSYFLSWIRSNSKV